MILASINKAITAETSLTRAIHLEVKALKSQLETHITESDALNNKAEGAYRIIRVITPTIWAALCAAMLFLYHNYSDFQQKVDERLTHIEISIKGLEDIEQVQHHAK